MTIFKKQMWIIVFSIAALGIITFLVNDRFATSKELPASSHTVTNADPVIPKSAMADAVSSASSINSDMSNTKSSASSSSEYVPGALTAAQREVLKKWQLERGYTFFLTNDEYKTYDKDTLQRLALLGDIRALQMLAEQSGLSDAAKDLYSKAAVRGSTWALSSLSRLSSSNSLVSDDPAAKKAYVVEAMAYAKVGAMRGDMEKYLTNLKVSVAMNPSELQLSESDYVQVKPLAEKIYKELESQRQALGLGAFDNSVPTEVIEYTKAFDPRLDGVKPRY